MTAGVYLIHFDVPYHHARHYVGWSGDIESRLALHRKGSSKARLMEVVHDAGIGWHVAWVWPGEDRTFERMIKDRKHTARFCPICRGRMQMSLWELLEGAPAFALDWDAIEEIAF